MKYRILALSLLVYLAGLSSAAEVRIRYSNGNYNSYTLFGSSRHPGTLFTPKANQYPVFVKKGHFGFNTGNVAVQVKVWRATGSVVGSLLASFPATTRTWPTWTDVDVSTAGIVIKAGNFFLSTNNPQMGPLGSAFRGANPNNVGHHWWSRDDVSWLLWTFTDWAIECTVDTRHVGVAPASLGRVKALYW
jgi:hypothetical protein